MIISSLKQMSLSRHSRPCLGNHLNHPKFPQGKLLLAISQKNVFAARVVNRSFYFIPVENSLGSSCATQGIEDLCPHRHSPVTKLLKIRIDMGLESRGIKECWLISQGSPHASSILMCRQSSKTSGRSTWINKEEIAEI